MRLFFCLLFTLNIPMTIITRKVNGLLIHLESLQPYIVSIESGKVVATFEGNTIEALKSDLESLKICPKSLSKVMKMIDHLIKTAAPS